jgi:methyl-accepting chemotaxis protein
VPVLTVGVLVGMATAAGACLGHLHGRGSLLAWLRGQPRVDAAALARKVATDQVAVAQALEAARAQGASLDALLLKVQDIGALLQQIGPTSATLREAADGGQRGLSSLSAAHQGLGGHMATLTQSIEQAATSLEEMVFSSNEVVSSIQNLNRAAEETAASINDMDVSMSQVTSQANAANVLSEKVSQDAEAGVAAINQTVEGIDKIRTNNRLAAEMIERLSLGIHEVAVVLSVIDDVAEQTNLLALNAAIIAAQAGEHGRGFAVVAEEIKALAERTGASTREIADIIGRIQDQSRHVSEVVVTGVQDVDAGTALGHNARDALQQVMSSAQKSVVMMHGIAQATLEQARGTKKINAAMSQVTETMSQIFYATSEQARGSEAIIENMAALRQVMVDVDAQLQVGTQAHESLGHMLAAATQAAEVLAREEDGDGLSHAALQKLVAKAQAEHGAALQTLAQVGQPNAV